MVSLVCCKFDFIVVFGGIGVIRMRKSYYRYKYYDLKEIKDSMSMVAFIKRHRHITTATIILFRIKL